MLSAGKRGQERRGCVKREGGGDGHDIAWIGEGMEVWRSGAGAAFNRSIMSREGVGSAGFNSEIVIRINSFACGI